MPLRQEVLVGGDLVVGRVTLGGPRGLVAQRVAQRLPVLGVSRRSPLSTKCCDLRRLDTHTRVRTCFV